MDSKKKITEKYESKNVLRKISNNDLNFLVMSEILPLIIIVIELLLLDSRDGVRNY
jgi:hypothetical protein